MIRSALGLISFITLTFGTAMVPLVVSMTIFNTAPFWTFLIGWIVLREAMSWFEIIALVLSFGAIVLIAFAK